MRVLVSCAVAFPLLLESATACSSISRHRKVRKKQKGLGDTVDTGPKGASTLFDRLLGEDNMNVKYPKLNGLGKSDVKVLFDVVVNKVVEFDLMAGVLQLSVFYQLFWNDGRLRFNGTKEVRPSWAVGEDALTVAEEAVWKPQILPFNSHGDEFCDTAVTIYDSTFLTEHGYNVLWSRPAIVNVHCASHLESFPFDTQECTLVVGPWSSTAPFSFHARRREVGNASSFQSEEWEVLGTSFQNARRLYRTGFTEEVRFSLTFRRYPYYLVINALMPIGLSVILNGLSMWLPIAGSSGERMTYSVTLLLTILAIALFTAALRPAVNEEMWLERSQSLCFLFAFFPVFESLLVVWLQHLFEKVEGSVGQRQVGSVTSDSSLQNPPPRSRRFSFLQHRSVAITALRAQEPTVRAKFVVYLMHQVPTLERCVSGRTAQPFTPLTLDRWCRLWLSVALLVLCALYVWQLPAGAFRRESVLVLLAAMAVVAAFYLFSIGCSLLFLLLEILHLCTQPWAVEASATMEQPQAKEEGAPEDTLESATGARTTSL